MKKLSLLFLSILCCLSVVAQDDFSFKFYGRIRADLFYNTRANNETVDGLFYMYPKDHAYDADGNDLNATPQGNMYMLYTRLGVNIKGPMLGSAKTSANVEVDFRGNSTQYSIARIRHAYMDLQWSKSSVLVGQTWHPLFGEVSPSILNLSTGAPFQPFNRSPQVRYRYKGNHAMLTAAAIWQMQYTSAGPDGKTHNYLKNSNVPELYVSADYVIPHWRLGIGAEMLSLKPRLTSTVDGSTYKVDERVTSLSAEVHAKYSGDGILVSAKTVLANNLTHCSMLGGFGVTDINPHNGEKTYVPFRHSMTWLNVVYGKKWQPGVFVGFLKNLGTGKAITGETYGTGLDVDRLLSANVQLSYNLPYWKLGVELENSTAWYGSLDKSDGKVIDTHSVNNFRVLGVVMFIF